MKLDQPVKVEVPVVTTGNAVGRTEGGILSVAAHEIVLEALPAKIPVRIEVDVTNLKIGGSIHVSELKAPEGCKFKFATDYVVAFVAVPEKEEVVAPVAAVPGAVPVRRALRLRPALRAPRRVRLRRPVRPRRPARPPAKAAPGKGDKGKK